MKRTIQVLAFGALFAVLLTGSVAPVVAQSVELPDGLSILNYEGNSFEPAATAFEGNWTDAGNEYTNVTEYDFANLESDGYDILLLPRTEGLTSTDIEAIATWYATGDKVIWVGGESDFSGFYDATDTANPLLEELGTSLRMSSISVEDPVSNDDAAYRVAPNQVGESSPFVDYTTANFDRMIMHGPAAIHYVADGEAADLRTATLGEGALENVDIHVKTSENAIPADSDISIVDADFYAYNNETTGDYPMLATDIMNGSMVVVSGESVFTDYKFMYGSADENGGDAHQGKDVVDRVLTYFYNEISGSSFLPFNSVYFLLGLSSMVAIVAIRRRH